MKNAGDICPSRLKHNFGYRSSNFARDRGPSSKCTQPTCVERSSARRRRRGRTSGSTRTGGRARPCMKGSPRMQTSAPMSHSAHDGKEKVDLQRTQHHLGSSYSKHSSLQILSLLDGRSSFSFTSPSALPSSLTSATPFQPTSSNPSPSAEIYSPPSSSNTLPEPARESIHIRRALPTGVKTRNQNLRTLHRGAQPATCTPLARHVAYTCSFATRHLGRRVALARTGGDRGPHTLILAGSREVSSGRAQFRQAESGAHDSAIPAHRVMRLRF